MQAVTFSGTSGNLRWSAVSGWTARHRLLTHAAVTPRLWAARRGSEPSTASPAPQRHRRCATTYHHSVPTRLVTSASVRMKLILRTGVQTTRTELAGSTRAMVTPDGSAATAGSPMNFSDRNGTPSKATCTGPSGARVRFVRNRHSTRASSCNSDTLPQQSPHHEQHVTATSTTSPLYCSMSHDVTNTILQQLQKHATSALATLHAAAEACSPGRP